MRISWKQWLRGSLVPFALAACGSISSPALTRGDDQPAKNNAFVAAPGDETQDETASPSDGVILTLQVTGEQQRSEDRSDRQPENRPRNRDAEPNEIGRAHV